MSSRLTMMLAACSLLRVFFRGRCCSAIHEYKSLGAGVQFLSSDVFELWYDGNEPFRSAPYSVETPVQNQLYD